jgi:hypothetical protein
MCTIKFIFSKKSFYFKHEAKIPEETKEQASRERHKVLKAKNKGTQNKKQRGFDLRKPKKRKG